MRISERTNILRIFNPYNLVRYNLELIVNDKIKLHYIY